MKNKTIGEILGVNKFPLKITDADGKLVYFENRAKYWVKYKFDERGNEILRECSDKYIGETTFNDNNQILTFKDTKGYWSKRMYDANGVQNYYSNSHGVVDDNRKVNFDGQEIVYNIIYK
jgi:hypothetical protein|tara:strand:- start:14859 stop:15218 length:360 start_codon:yes stop_codon:yes gene_type:complete